MVSSVGSGSLTVEVVMAVSVQSRASCSGILVNSDFTSKETSVVMPQYNTVCVI